MMFRTQRIRNAVVAAITGFAAIQQITPLWAQSSDSPEHCRQLTGTPGQGEGAGWGSGWIDLIPIQDFYEGYRLRILVGGDAKRVLVQLLQKGTPPGTGVGIIGGVVDVPASRQIDIPIPEKRNDIRQIAVHGGSSPLGISLGAKNPPATLASVCLLR